MIGCMIDCMPGWRMVDDWLMIGYAWLLIVSDWLMIG